MEKINAVNVLDFTTLNHRSSIPLLTIYKTTCDSSRRLTKYDVDNDGMGRWAHKESECRNLDFFPITLMLKNTS